MYYGGMLKTKYAVIGVVIALAILVGLLIAVRVSAPTDMEASVLQASVVFASGADTSYPVSVVLPDEAGRARTALIDKMFAGAGNAMDVREEYLYPAPQPTLQPQPEEPIFIPTPYPYGTTTLPEQPVATEVTAPMDPVVTGNATTSADIETE